MTNHLITKNLISNNLSTIAKEFAAGSTLSSIEPFGNGNINDTFLIALDDPDKTRFVLQRINTTVFRQPQLIMKNMRILSEHVLRRLQKTALDRRWEIPRVLLTKDMQDYCCDSDQSFWRAVSFIDHSESFDRLQNVDQAREVGYALGMFHHLICDLPPETLADTLEGFHITPLYLQTYEKVLAKTRQSLSPEVSHCLQFVSDRAVWAQVLEQAKLQGKLPLRLMHGDPKVNNVMFDRETGQAVSVVDLDTVKPGLVHYDVGDCLRSGCNPAGEETEQWEAVYFDPDLCRSILQGYLSVATDFLTENDYAYLFDAIRLIAFELGLRFFTDYLAGNVYFKVKHPEHNLARALVQFRLTESIESQERAICSLIQEMK